MEIEASLRQLRRCRYPSGLYAAVPADSHVRVRVYKNVWIRDTIYMLLAFEALDLIDELRQGAYALLDRILLRWAYKLDWCIVNGAPETEWHYLHPRFGPDGHEIHSELWSLKQDDAVGLALWGLSRWQEHFDIFRDDYSDFHLMQKLVWYLDRINVPHVPDSGIWEEGAAIHLSSLAAVAAGLNRASRIGVRDIPDRLRAETTAKIEELAGKEAEGHETDLALLTIVWPLGDDVPIPRTVQREMVERVERDLTGKRGVIRYRGDSYTACHDGPPEWTMGFGFLALAWNALGDSERAHWYLRRLEGVFNDAGELPESWCRDSHARYFNSPLGWAHALHLVAAAELGTEDSWRVSLHGSQGSALDSPPNGSLY
jgi:GH15 family glucan-1,4-alpha-glucosidase